MQIKIKRTNITLTPNIEAYLDKKLETLQRFVDAGDGTALCEVEMEKMTHHQTGDVFIAEINLMLGGKQFRVVAQEATPMAAIDGAKDQMLLELGRNKKKERALARHAGAAVKAMQRGLDFAGELPRRGVRLAMWGRKEFRGYWPFK